MFILFTFRFIYIYIIYHIHQKVNTFYKDF
nr:MAG TPA: hypothetical protein [Bacteriophage sp.]